MVTTNEVKQYLRIDGTDEDAVITSLIEAATQEAIDYLNRDFEGEDEVVPGNVKLWIKRRVAYYYEQRTGNLKDTSVSGVKADKYEEDYELLKRWRKEPGF